MQELKEKANEIKDKASAFTAKLFSKFKKN